MKKSYEFVSETISLLFFKSLTKRCRFKRQTQKAKLEHFQSSFLRCLPFYTIFIIHCSPFSCPFHSHILSSSFSPPSHFPLPLPPPFLDRVTALTCLRLHLSFACMSPDPVPLVGHPGSFKCMCMSLAEDVAPLYQVAHNYHASTARPGNQTQIIGMEDECSNR